MDVLKSLPIAPLAVTLGQLTVPVALCSTFQATVLAIGVMAGAITIWQMGVAAILLVPFSVFIFASENLVFMIAPYRRNQEGVMTFVRTILTFTAKGVFLLVVLVGVISWAWISRQIASCFADPRMVQPALFGFGIWILTAASAAATTWKLTRIYDRFDPSTDAPAVS